MSECEKLQPLIEDYLGDELSPADKARLDQHLPTCAECRSLIALHHDLARPAGKIAEPAPAEFRAMRSRVLAATVAQPDVAPKRVPGYTPGKLAASILAIAATLVLGIFVGRLSVGTQRLDDRLLLNTVVQQANTSHELDDYWDRPLSYANIAAGPVRNGQVNLGFDVCSRLEVTTRVDSSLASELLSYAVLDSDSVGERLRAIEVAGASNDPRLTEALMVTLENDPEVAVRVEALNVLAKKPQTSLTQSALLSALRQDQSVQIRLMALEQLVGQELASNQISEAILQGNQQSDRAVLQRAYELQGDAKPKDWL